MKENDKLQKYDQLILEICSEIYNASEPEKIFQHLIDEIINIGSDIFRSSYGFVFKHNYDSNKIELICNSQNVYKDLGKLKKEAIIYLFNLKYDQTAKSNTQLDFMRTNRKPLLVFYSEEEKKAWHFDENSKKFKILKKMIYFEKIFEHAYLKTIKSSRTLKKSKYKLGYYTLWFPIYFSFLNTFGIENIEKSTGKKVMNEFWIIGFIFKEIGSLNNKIIIEEIIKIEQICTQLSLYPVAKNLFTTVKDYDDYLDLANYKYKNKADRINKHLKIILNDINEDRIGSNLLNEINEINFIKDSLYETSVIKKKISLFSIITKSIENFENQYKDVIFETNNFTEAKKYYDDLIEMSEDSIKHVFNELFKNAYESYSSEKDKKIIILDFILERNKRSNLLLTIEDYGGGISENIVHKIWEKKFSTKGSPGNGLPDVKVKLLQVGVYGADIEFIFRKNKKEGSIFEIEFNDIIPKGG